MEKILSLAKKIIPKNLIAKGRPAYHYLLAFLGAIYYRFPSKQIKVVAITGTKGKTTTAELVNAILEEAGLRTAIASTLRFKIGEKSEDNKYKMTMPGRFFMQNFLRKAVDANCDWAVIEMSSEGAKQFRHKFIDLDALIFTNLAPEHIESHGSYQKYLEAKLSIAKALEDSTKGGKIIVSNIDDKEGQKFLDVNISDKFTYSIKDAEPFSLQKEGLVMIFDGVKIVSRLTGKFNIYNMLAAATFAEAEGIGAETIKKALEKVSVIRGRVERIREGQSFDVVVDYAHTPDSLRELYEAFLNQPKVCVLGNCGGGRDRWKRKEMALIAEKYCDKIILTDEDPYDDEPREIVEDMAREMVQKRPEIIMDRRKAIKKAIEIADKNGAVLITGKGTDPYIMRKNGDKEEWSDANVVKEELKKFLNKQHA